MKKLAMIILWLFPIVVLAEDLYFVDAHSQYEKALDGEIIIRKMDDAGVKKAIISTRRGRGPWDAVELAQAYPGRIIPSVRIKGQHYSRNTKKFYKKLKKQVKSDDFSAMSEVLMYHAQKGNKADEVVVHANDRRVKKSLNAAINNGWPYVVHIEFASLSRGDAEEFMQGLETLLSENLEHPFALIHMGQLDAETVSALLSKYKNIYFITSHANPVTAKKSNQPWINMFDGEEFKPQWETLMLKYPDRFIFAVDAVWTKQWRFDYEKHVNIWRAGLSALPEEIAHKIAHGNAERLWGIDSE